MYCPSGISPMGNLGCFPQGKPAATESRYPTYCACWVFWCFHNPPHSDFDCGFFNVRTDVNACNCTQGWTDTVRKSALKRDSREKKKKLAAPGNRTCVGGVPVRCSNQLSYIPTSFSWTLCSRLGIHRTVAYPFVPLSVTFFQSLRSQQHQTVAKIQFFMYISRSIGKFLSDPVQTLSG